MARASTALSFNLSHSGHLALYAFSKAGAVGVDVEVARRGLDVVAIAARAFGAAEARRLRGFAPAIRKEEFRRTWVRHESALKCWGTGIGNGSTESSRASRGSPSSIWACEAQRRWSRAHRTSCAAGIGTSERDAAAPIRAERATPAVPGLSMSTTRASTTWFGRAEPK